ncbi:unnamed protein product [Litomosoides sigmodontis]|uniref:Fibronectin type-III domain-containing protein n=1 Tax=Litomosoides sigmodontis TaxID=42156 RepID=A0A3P6V316_LITSI|nr:unnamed protein product [Litomosoides sigmodontis]
MLLLHDFRSLFHILSLLLISYHGTRRSQAATIDRTLVPSRVQNFRARYDHPTDAIYTQWSYPEEILNKVKPEFVVRYRITSRPVGLSEFDWKYSHVGTKVEARLDLDEIRNGDELQAQVRAESRDGTVVEDWSQSLLISITKHVVIDGVPATDDDLLPPVDFQAHILNTSVVRLEWTSPFRALSSGQCLILFDIVPKNYYYIVNVKQLTSADRTPLLRQQVKIQANSFTLGNLKPGQRYELTIRTASSPEQDEYFEVGNLIISSHFKESNQGAVNLTWEVPEKMRNLIQEYLLKIRTHLTNNLITESGQFRFRTPAVVKNPIRKVDVIYAHEIDGVLLQWTLENFLSTNLIDGYNVYVSDNPDAPHAEWSYYSVSGSDLPNNAFTSGANSLILHDLRPGHTYYVRINVRKKDGEVLRAPSIYRFKTLERAEFLELSERNTLSYKLLSPDRVQITWAYPSSILPLVTGSLIMYAESNSLPTKQWRRITLVNPLQNSVVLEHLKPNSHYFVRILPQINNTFYDNSIIDTFEVRTGPESMYLSSFQFSI